MTKTDDLMALAEKYQCSESPLKSARELRTAIEQALLQAHKEGFDAALLPGSVPDAQPVAAFDAWYDENKTAEPYDAWQAATLAERERCAKCCDPRDDMAYSSQYRYALANCAAEIRKGTT